MQGWNWVGDTALVSKLGNETKRNSCESVVLYRLSKNRWCIRTKDAKCNAMYTVHWPCVESMDSILYSLLFGGVRWQYSQELTDVDMTAWKEVHNWRKRGAGRRCKMSKMWTRKNGCNVEWRFAKWTGPEMNVERCWGKMLWNRKGGKGREVWFYEGIDSVLVVFRKAPRASKVVHFGFRNQLSRCTVEGRCRSQRHCGMTLLTDDDNDDGLTSLLVLSNRRAGIVSHTIGLLLHVKGRQECQAIRIWTSSGPTARRHDGSDEVDVGNMEAVWWSRAHLRCVRIFLDTFLHCCVHAARR